MRKLIIAVICLILMACSQQRDDHHLRVGTMAGPETELMQVAKQVAEKEYGLTIEMVEFSDYPMPNRALHEGSLDANMMQHQPYLTASMNDHGYQLMALGKTYIYPMAIYSKKIKSLQDMPVKAKIAIPNDPSNEARALLLLEKANLIRLKANVDIKATTLDIIDNPKQIKFIEIDAAQLPRALNDVSAAVINTNYAIPAGLSLSKDSLFSEDQSSKFANILVIRTQDKNKLQLQQLLTALQSPAVQDKAKHLFGDAAIKAF